MFSEELKNDLYALADLGGEMQGILQSDAYQTGLTLARARIFEGWTSSASAKERDNLHADLRALERLEAAFKDIDDEGAVAREAIRRMQEAVSDTDL